MASKRFIPTSQLSATTLNRLQKHVGVRNQYELITLAAAAGARLGRGEKQQTNKAIAFFAKHYNNEIQLAREKAEVDRETRRIEQARLRIAERSVRTRPTFYTAHVTRDIVRRVINTKDGQETVTISKDFVAKTKKALKKAIQDWDDFTSAESYYISTVSGTSKVSGHTGSMGGTNAIREAGAVDLNGLIPNTAWCRNRGMCVPDWLMHKYSDVKGHIKSVKTDEIIEYYSTYWLEESTTRKEIDNHPNRDGYTIENIELFCRNTNKTLIALHNDEIIVERRVQSCEDPLVIEIKNNHLYPITDNSKIRSLTHRGTVSCFKAKAKKGKEGEEVALPLVHLEKKEMGLSELEFLVKIIEERKIQPYGNKLRLTNDKLHNFEIGGKIYCTTPLCEPVKQYCSRKDIPYKGQSAVQFVAPFLDKLPVSKLNDDIRNALYRESVKHRTHYGLFKDEKTFTTTPEFCEKHIGMDFNKFYRNIMYKPIDDWMTIDTSTTIMETSTFTGEFGLWFVRTDDMTLMHKSNWYSNNTIQRASEIGIDFTVCYFIAGVRNNKSLIPDIIDEMGECFNDPALTKLCINAISGYLGQTCTKKTNIQVDTNVERVWDMVKKLKNNVSNMVYYAGEPNEDGKRTHVYGTESKQVKLITNLPMYIQILDWANIQLNDAILTRGGYSKLVFRKTDEFVMEKVDGMDYKLSDAGLEGIKESEVDSRTFKYLPREPVEYKYKARDWNPIPDVKTSDDHGKVIKMLQGGKSLMISSRAGTGKSYIINKVADAMPVAKIAYTNKAANNIGGMTIHKFLGIDQQGGIKIGEVIKNVNQYKAVVIDEYSMIPNDLWFLLYQVKQATKVPFLVCGDFRQLPPVEDGMSNDYSNHPNVKNISGYIRTELEFTDKCRYDSEMAEYLERIWNEQVSEITYSNPTAEGSHICYTNQRRKEINAALNKSGKLITYEGNPNKYNEDIRLEKGTKLLALVTNTKYNIIKNECYEVTEVNGENFKIKGIEQSLEIKQIHTFFCLAYAVTIHKAQGMTISGVLNIHEIDTVRKNKRMFYTAVSRATSLTNIRYMQ